MRILPRLSAVLLGAMAVVVAAMSLAGPAGAQTLRTLIDPGTGNPLRDPSYLIVYDGALYFRANNQPHGNNVELWSYDGLAASLAAEITPGDTGSDPTDLAVYDGKLYFAAPESPGGWYLMCYDRAGGAAYAPYVDVRPRAPFGMIPFGGNLIYRGSAVVVNGSELWRFDGAAQTPISTPAGNRVVLPQCFRQFGDQLYFSAWGPDGCGAELYRTNGTTAARVTDINPGLDGSEPAFLAVYNNALYFRAYNNTTGYELWRFDGTDATRAIDPAHNPVNPPKYPWNLCVYKGKLYFAADDGVHGSELWSFDGTTARMVVEINPTPDPLDGDTWMMNADPSYLTVYEGRLYFSANDGAHGEELWSYDADTDTASLVWDICPGHYGSRLSELTVWGDSLYFSADDGTTSGLGSVGPWAMEFTIPEPAALALLALGGLAALAWRRKTP